MARHGVDYESVKQAALKLLSKGTSPSVQKVRELLGTGSNTTIAEHLKYWREEHAAKKVHHLPASIPEELIATFETLWQTAMEHAEQHLANVKATLEDREEKLQQETALTNKTMDDLKLQIAELKQKIEDKTQENQALHTQLAVANERFETQASEIDKLKQQYDLRLKHLLNEKHQAIEKIDQLQREMIQYQQSLSDQAEKYHAVLAKERELQDDSEKRWAKLIDQARMEASQLRKECNGTVQMHAKKIERLQNTHLDLHSKLSSQQGDLKNKERLIVVLEARLESLQAEHTLRTSAAAKLQEKGDALMINDVNGGMKTA